MAYDRKYGRVTTQFGDIGEDEPVIVFRARDSLVPEMLKLYGALCRGAGSPERHVKIVENTRDAVMRWQSINAPQVRVPSSTGSEERLPE